MKAAKMFEQLNWDILIDNQEFILYQNDDFIRIIFDKKSGAYTFVIPSFYMNVSSKVKIPIDKKLHVAICKQIEELKIP